MLPSLKHLPRDEAESVLASFAKTLLPTPEEHPPSFPDPALAARLLQELQQRAEIVNIKNPDEVRGRVFSVLAQELSSYALRSSNINEIKARLGERGVLRSDYYKIELPPNIRELHKRGIRPNHIESAIRYPSAVEHLTQEGSDPTGEPELLISLFAKTIGSLTDAHGFTLLVESQRIGATQRVLGAWRIYHADIQWPSRATPLAILKAFVEVFGVIFEVGDGPPTKFVLYQRIPVPKDRNEINLLRFQKPDRHDLASQQLLRINSEGYAEVAIAFIIDMTIYLAALRGHPAAPVREPYSERASEVIKMSGEDRLFVERGSEGGYAVRRRDSERASDVLPTQAEAIERARELNPGAPPLVERVRYTTGGKPDKWRKP